jgi:hypothetical protein
MLVEREQKTVKAMRHGARNRVNGPPVEAMEGRTEQCTVHMNQCLCNIDPAHSSKRQLHNEAGALIG